MDGDEMVDVIILAGEQLIKGLENAGNKALYLINRKMMIEYVIDAVKAAEGIKRIVVVGPKDKLSRHLYGKVDAVIDSGGNVIENVMAGIRYLKPRENILICSCDIPLITTEAINDFISRSKMLNADLCYPIIEKAVNNNKYPDMERTYVRIKEGKFTGGNIFYVNPKAIENGLLFADKLIKARKNPLKMARLLSFTFMLRLVFGNLAISAVEERFSRVTGIKARAIVSLFPEVGQDVDKSSDLNMASHYLNG
ncbi:MAG TPA: NTP transferase domain-containing protein [Clostridiaceae bacterium]|nr:NTP transferase domain-containing protein [Clostridiaceae bacterium]